MELQSSIDTNKLAEALVAAGEFATVSDVVSAGVLALANRAAIREQVANGLRELDEGRFITSREVFETLRQRVKVAGGIEVIRIISGDRDIRQL